MREKKMIVRMMHPKDLPSLWRLAAAQNRRDGTSYPFPPVFDLAPSSSRHGQFLQNVALALVTEVNGRVRMGHVFLRTVEAMSFGGGREEMDFSAWHIPVACDILRQQGYDDLHTLVPRNRADEAHEQLLRSYGLQRIDNRLAHFFKMLVPDNPEKAGDA